MCKKDNELGGKSTTGHLAKFEIGRAADDTSTCGKNLSQKIDQKKLNHFVQFNVFMLGFLRELLARSGRINPSKHI